MRGWVARAAKAQIVAALIGLHGRQQGQAYQYRIVVLVAQRQRRATAERQLFLLALSPAVGADEQAIEVLHPLPRQLVQIMDAVVIGRLQAYGLGRLAGRTR